jgi:hypothetical protein
MREANANVNLGDGEFNTEIGLEDSPRSVNTNTKVVILWDMLKVSARLKILIFHQAIS